MRENQIGIDEGGPENVISRPVLEFSAPPPQIIMKPSSIPPVAIIKCTSAIFGQRVIRPKEHLDLESEEIGNDVDAMIEAKDKEQTVLQLYRIHKIGRTEIRNFAPDHGDQGKKAKEGEQTMIDGVEGEERSLRRCEKSIRTCSAAISAVYFPNA
ncbi:hypothetical protein EV368DRAFT_62935 [Lentinula lateritia]|nr:hypothetical protein EV368DRAFT_62935 [Lentinula lateritia]